MSRPAEEAASRAFLEKLLGNIEDETSRQEVEYMVEELFPVLIPGIVNLLKARLETQRQREDEEDETALPIQPLDHLARFLMRHNPRHTEPTSETAQMKALARKLLRK